MTVCHLITYDPELADPVDGDTVLVVVSFDFVGVTGSAMTVDRTIGI
jgi:hypothetical protein